MSEVATVGNRRVMKLLILAFFTVQYVHAGSIVKISGTIKQPLSDSISVSYNDNRIAYVPKEYFARIDKKGNFSLSFPVPDGVYTQLELKHGNKLAELLVAPGDSLVMNVESARFDSSIHYKGRGSDIQNFMALHTLQMGRMNQFSLKMRALIAKSPSEFLNCIEAEKAKEHDFLVMNNARLSAEFVKYWEAYYRYYSLFFIEQYPQMHEVVRLKRFTDTIPDINYRVIQELPYSFNDSLLQVPPYLLYLTGILEIKQRAAGYFAFAKDIKKALAVQDSLSRLALELMPGTSAAYYLAQGMYGRMRDQPIERTKAQYDDFKTRWPTSEYLPMLSQQKAIAERLAPGQPAPDFDLSVHDGHVKKLSDLKDTVVYLGFWAGWCRQCVGEMIGGEQKIKDLIRNKPLKFVYVSINKDTAMDAMLIKKYKISGTFTQVTGEWQADLVRQYGVQSLPAYYLIDQQGNFALQNPPSPAQWTELLFAIEKLFK